LIGCRDNDNTPFAAFFADNFEKLSDLSATLTNEREHCHIGACSTRHHAQQRALADAASAKNADALTASAGYKCVECADAATECFANGHAVERERRGAIHPHGAISSVFAIRIKRHTGCVYDSAQEIASNPDGWPGSPSDNSVAETNTFGVFHRHGKHGRSAKTNHLARIFLAPGVDHFARFTDGAERPFRLDKIAYDLQHSSAPTQG
jgi:hypothetical protein